MYVYACMKAAETNMKKKFPGSGIFVPIASAICHLIMTVYFFPSVKEDEPALAKEERGSADSHTTEDRYKVNNSLIYVTGSLTGKQMKPNCHCVGFKVVTK